MTKEESSYPTQPSATLASPIPSHEVIHSNATHSYMRRIFTLFCVLILTNIFYRIWPTLITSVQYIVHPREQIGANGITYSTVTYFTKKAEDPVITPIIIKTNDIVYTIPPGIGDCTNVKVLNIGYNPITSLPDSIGNMSSLDEMLIINTLLQSLPNTIGNISNLRILELHGNRISTLPDSIGSLENLTLLNLAHNRLSSLPPTIGQLARLDVLDVTGNNLTSFPTILPPNLKSLYIGGNRIPMKELEAAQYRFAESDLIIYY